MSDQMMEKLRELSAKWRSQIGDDTYENSIDCDNKGDIYNAGCNDTSVQLASELDALLAIAPQSTPRTPEPDRQAARADEIVEACCRELCYWCRTGHQATLESFPLGGSEWMHKHESFNGYKECKANRLRHYVMGKFTLARDAEAAKRGAAK